MPALTLAQIASLRDHPHTLGKQYLYVHVPDVVFAAQVNGDVGRVQTIPYHNVTQGAFTSVYRGMTLLVGTAAGARDKGFIRIRQAATATNLYTTEHEMDLKDGDYLTVLDEYRLWHVDPYIHTDGTIYKDWNGVAPGGAIAFPANWQDIYQPVPVMGPHSIEFIDPSTGLASHWWDWSRSWPINPLAGDGLIYVAVFEGGTPNSSFAETGTVTWGTAGHRWAHLAVQDTQGIISYTSRRLYVTLDRDNLPPNCYVDFVPSPRMGSVEGGGFSMQFTVYIDVPESAFPDHALVIWFFDGGTQDDVGGNWPCRSHIHFIGYVRKASTHKEPETGTVTFEASTIDGVMRSLPMFPNFYEDVAAGDCNVWTEAVSLTVQRAACLHMRWNSSLLEMADVIFDPAAPTAIGEHEFPEGFLYDQLNALVNRDYMYRIGCDPLGTIYFNKDPQYRTIAPATIMTIESQDWREELDFPEPLEPQTAYVIASGNAYTPPATVTPLFSEAPGPVPLQLGKKDKSLSRLICTTQDALNTIAGLALAAENNDFPDIPVKLDGQYYIGHLFPMEFVGLDIGSTDTKRQMDLSSDLFIPRRSMLQVVYDKDRAVSHSLTDINVERLTTGEGVPGQPLIYPTEPPTPPGPDEGPDGGDWPPPIPPTPTPTVAGSIVVSHDVDGVYWSDNRGGSWENRQPGAFLDLIWDPWWFTSYRSGTSDPAYSILWGCGVGFIVRSGQDAGHSLIDVTPTTDPPNVWGDATPPTANTVTYKQIHGDMCNLDTFYVLAEWQEVNSGFSYWRGWLAKTVDNGVTWTWAVSLDWDTYYYMAAHVSFTPPTSLTNPTNGLGVPDGNYALFENKSDNLWGYWVLDIGYTLPQAPDRGEWYGFGWTFPAGHWWYSNIQISPDGTVWTDLGNTGQGLNVAWRGRNYAGAVVPRYVRIAVNPGSNALKFSRGIAVDSVRLRIPSAVSTSLRPLAMDVDTEDGTRLYLTLWRDGTLYLENRTTVALDVVTTRTTIGAATAAQVADKTRFVVPRQPHLLAVPDGDLVWVFGRWDDGTPRHISYSSDGGATLVSREDAAWDVNHRVGAFEAMFDNQTLYAFINHAVTPRLWRSIDQGVNWVNINSVPFNVEFEAFTRCTWAADEFFIGRNGPGAQMAAWIESPYTGTWVDATGSPSLPTAAGAISAVIWV